MSFSFSSVRHSNIPLFILLFRYIFYARFHNFFLSHSHIILYLTEKSNKFLFTAPAKAVAHWVFINIQPGQSSPCAPVPADVPVNIHLHIRKRKPQHLPDLAIPASTVGFHPHHRFPMPFQQILLHSHTPL